MLKLAYRTADDNFLAVDNLNHAEDFIMKQLKLTISTLLLCMLMSITALAGTWKSDSIGWWYENSDGTYPINGWQWIDGNNDGTAECYYFDARGYCLLNTTTPDGYAVDGNGAWIINDLIQTKSVTPSQTAQTTQSSQAETGTQNTQNTYTGISATPYDGYTIIANTNTHKYHVPSCSSVNAMKDSNKGYCSDADYLLSLG